MKYLIHENFIKSIPKEKKELVLGKLNDFCNFIELNHERLARIHSGFSIRKINGLEGIFKFRVNSGDRILFTTTTYLKNKRSGYESCPVFLKFVNHDDQIRDARREMFIERYTELESEKETEILSEEIYADILDFNNYVSYEIKSDECLKALADEDKIEYYYYLNDEQYEAAIKKLPLCVSGSAGSGKTTVALRKVFNIEELNPDKNIKIGYFTYTKHLKDFSEKVYNKYHINNDEDTRKTQFFDINSYCFEQMEYNPENLVMFNKFEEWFESEKRLSSENLAVFNFDVSYIWAEIRGIIKGFMLYNWKRFESEYSFIIPLEKYLELSDKYTNFTSEQKKEIYILTEKYNIWLKKNGFYDETDLAVEVIKQNEKGKIEKFDVVICDECQDLNEVQLFLLTKLLNNKENIFLCGDIHQIVNPTFFNFERIQELYYGEVVERAALQKNYRSQSEIVKLANTVSNIRRMYIGDFGINDYNEIFIREGEKSIFLTYSEKVISQIISFLIKRSYSVLVVTDEKEKKKYNRYVPGRVFTVSEIKGLEYDIIITLNLLSENKTKWQELYRGKGNIKGQRGRNNEYRYYINEFYVAVTRAKKFLCVIENDIFTELFEDIKENFEFHDEPDYMDTRFSHLSTEKEWIEQALYLEDMEMYAQAAEIYKTLKNREKYIILLIKYYILNKIFPEDIDITQIASFREIADIFFDFGEYDEALKYYKLSDNKTMEITIKILECQKKYEEIGDLYLSQNQKKFASRYYNIEKNKNLELKIKIHMCNDEYEKAGDLLFENEQFEAAFETFSEIKFPDIKIQAKMFACKNRFIDAGDLLFNNKYFNEALQYYQHVKEINPDIEAKIFLIKNDFKKAGDTFFETGDFNNALDCYKKIDNLKLKNDADLQARIYFCEGNFSKSGDLFLLADNKKYALSAYNNIREETSGKIIKILFCNEYYHEVIKYKCMNKNAITEENIICFEDVRLYNIFYNTLIVEHYKIEKNIFRTFEWLIKSIYSYELRFFISKFSLNSWSKNIDNEVIDYLKEKSIDEDTEKYEIIRRKLVNIHDVKDFINIVDNFNEISDKILLEEKINFTDQKSDKIVSIKDDFVLIKKIKYEETFFRDYLTYLDYEFYLGKYPVTFSDYDKFSLAAGNTPADDYTFDRESNPVVGISWDDAVKYCNWLSKMEGLPPAYNENGELLDENGNITYKLGLVKGFRLPSIEEWINGAVSGDDKITSLKWAGTTNKKELPLYAHYNSDRPIASGTLKPNTTGLYDMNGNVWEMLQTTIGGNIIAIGGAYNSTIEELDLSKHKKLNKFEKFNNVGFRILYVK